MYSSSAFRILLESDEDRLLVVFNRGLVLMTEVNILLHFTVDLSHFNILPRLLVLWLFRISGRLLNSCLDFNSTDR